MQLLYSRGIYLDISIIAIQELTNNRSDAVITNLEPETLYTIRIEALSPTRQLIVSGEIQATTTSSDSSKAGMTTLSSGSSKPGMHIFCFGVGVNEL